MILRKDSGTGTEREQDENMMAMLKKITRRDVTRLFWWLVVLLPADAAAMCVRARREKGKILVLRVDALGDFVVWLDAARGTRALHPSAEITLLCNRTWQSLAEQAPYFDRTWAMDRKKFVTNPFYRFRLIAQVRRAGFSTLINPIWTRDFLWSDTLARASGIDERVCYSGDFSIITPALMRLVDSWYTRVIRSRAEPRQELERNADFLRALGATDFRAGLPALPRTPGLPEGLPEGDYYVLIPGAGKAYRQWPLEDYAQTARRLHERTGWAGVVIGAEQDRALGETLAADREAGVQNWAGRTSLSDLIRIIAGARLVVGSETGGLHIAAALAKPSVCILGGGHYGRYVPYRTETPDARPLPVAAAHPMPCFGCDWACIYKVPPDQPKPCIAGISAEAVWQAIEPLLPPKSAETHRLEESDPVGG